MTKQQILDHLKYIVLCISISLLLTNCNNTDNEIVTEPKLENSKLTKGKLQDFEEVSTYVEQLQRTRANAMHAESDLENTNDFSILYDQDMHIQQDAGFTTYSIPVLRETPVENTFSNLVIRFSDIYETEAFLINYTPVGSYLDDVAENELTPFIGEATIEAIVYDGSLDHLAENNSDCVAITIKYCDWENNQHGAVHLAGENCTEGYMFYVTTFVCFGDDVPSLVDISVPGDGDPNVSGYLYTSGTAGGSSTTHPPIVIPTVPRVQTILNVEGITFEMNEWLNQPQNYFFKQDMLDFQNEEGHLENTEIEIYLMLKSESSNQPWIEQSGLYNNLEILPYTHIRNFVDTTHGYTYTEFKLTSGDIIMRGDFAKTIGNEGSFTTEPDMRTYYYNKETARLYRMPEPNSLNDFSSAEYLLSSFWDVVVIGARYCTPAEEGIILVDGKDFEGVEQSRAVAGIFLIVDFIPAGKVLKIVRKVGNVTPAIPVVVKLGTNIYKLQLKLFKKYKNIIADMSNTRKGNFGEMGVDVDAIQKGYDVKHTNRITDIDQGGHHDIDHVFQNPQTGEYLIVETKYKPSGNMAYTNLADPNTGLPRQMSDEWILQNNRLRNSVGDDLADDIIESGYIRLLAVVNPDGTITYRTINASGNVMNGEAGIYRL